jgi:hypothetical protein
VVRVPGCRTEMYCVSCEVRTEFIYVEESRCKNKITCCEKKKKKKEKTKENTIAKSRD